MIDAVRPGRTHVGCGYPQVLQKDAVIGPAPQISYRHVASSWRRRSAATLADGFGRDLRLIRARQASLTPCVINSASLRTGHDLGYLANKLLQAGDRGSSELRSRDSYVHVEVCRRTRQVTGVLLSPFG